VSYAKSLELLGLSSRALTFSFHAIQRSEISIAASRAIDKLIRTGTIAGEDFLLLTTAVYHLLSQPIDIVSKTCVVEGYTFLIAQNSDKDQLPQHLSAIMEALGIVDVEQCDSSTALYVLKIIFAVGKTLYTTAPRKLSAPTWIEGDGRKMAEWVRGTIATFSQRFPEDFEVMEVIDI
jgi:hypothetical protein